MTGTTRRQVIVGSTMLALSPAGFTPALEAEHTEHQKLIALGLELERHKRRVRDLHRRLRSDNTTAAWQGWSDASADLARLCERIARMPATSLTGIAVRYEALAVGLLDDDVIMDEEIKRQAVALRRALRKNGAGR